MNLSAHLYKIIPFFRTTNYFSSAHKIKWSEHSVGCDTLHVFFINPLVKIWSIGDAGVVNLVLIVEINARMILYNFCESVTPHVSTHQKKTKYAYQVNFTMAVHICKAFLQKSSPTISPHIETLLLRYLGPVKPGRKFPRTKKRKGFVSFAYRVS